MENRVTLFSPTEPTNSGVIIFVAHAATQIPHSIHLSSSKVSYATAGSIRLSTFYDGGGRFCNKRAEKRFSTPLKEVIF